MKEDCKEIRLEALSGRNESMLRQYRSVLNRGLEGGSRKKDEKKGVNESSQCKKLRNEENWWNVECEKERKIEKKEKTKNENKKCGTGGENRGKSKVVCCFFGKREVANSQLMTVFLQILLLASVSLALEIGGNLEWEESEKELLQVNRKIVKGTRWLKREKSINFSLSEIVLLVFTRFFPHFML